MKILAVDDEQLMLDALTYSIQIATPDDEVFSFRRGSEALEFAKRNPIDVAFLDIRMRGMDGLELGRRLLEERPDTNLIYCTSYEEYIAEAFRNVRCNGYITKPVDAEQIKEELKHLRMPMVVETKEPEQKKIDIRCLGRFDVFVNGNVMKFQIAKTKELLAFLVHARGGICSNQEISVALWEDDTNHYSYLKKMRNDLINTLEKYDCSELLIQVWGGLAVNMDCFQLDFDEWRRLHRGQRPNNYMSQYSWSRDFDWE